MTQPSPLSDSHSVAKNPAAIKAEGATLAVRSCLRVAARHAARSMAVCRAGGLVAFHFQTAAGEVIVTATEADFTASCRGPRDHNGSPFVAPAVQLTAEDLPPPEPKPARTRRGMALTSHRRRSPQLIERLQSAVAHKSATGLSWSAVARAFQLTHAQLINFAQQQRKARREVAAS